MVGHEGVVALETVPTVGAEIGGGLWRPDHHVKGVEDVAGVAGWRGEY